MAGLTWGFTVGTLNRPDVLERAVALALLQTRPPVEITIVDGSHDWAATRDRIAAIVARHPETRLIYEPTTNPSSSRQRNRAVELATQSDIVFVVDDDTLLFPETAETVLKVFEADADRVLQAAALTETVEMPGEADGSGSRIAAERRQSTEDKRAIRSLTGVLKRLGLLSWVRRHILLHDLEERLVPYDGAWHHHPLPPPLQHFNISWVHLIQGSELVCRRDRFLAERFCDDMEASSSGHDIDLCYRLSRAGPLCRVPDALYHHLQATGGRIDRHKHTLLQAMNTVVLTRRFAPDPASVQGRLRLHMARRLLADGLSDLFAGRFGFPKARADLTAIGFLGDVFRSSREEVDRWYVDAQRRVLAQEPPGSPSSGGR
ncbi:MAG: glycosyltransferase [Pseudomonadota bacterium]